VVVAEVEGEGGRAEEEAEVETEAGTCLGGGLKAISWT